jgi:hypothetical protein
MRSGLTGGLALAATVAAGALLIACGGDDDELTKAQLIEQADAICKRGNEEINDAANKAFPGNRQPSEAEATKFAEETLIPNVQNQIDEVRDLNPPSADEAQVTAFLDEAQQALDRVEDDPTILFGGGQSPFARANQMGQDYGFKECSSD